MARKLRLRRYAGLVPSVSMVLLVAACSSDSPTGVTDSVARVGELSPQYVWWGPWCPDCEKRAPNELESTRISEGFQHVNQACMNSAFGLKNGVTAWAWLDSQIYADKIGIDEEVGSRAEWDYAVGYWVPEGLRYQYAFKPMYLDQGHAENSSLRGLAITMIHETAHEFGYASQQDEGIAEAIGWVCSF